jgi:raffinose/stachyose/melibiose transport system permease protein
MATMPDAAGVSEPMVPVPSAASRRGRRLLGRLTPLLLILPAVIVLGWLMLYPLGDAVRLSLTNWDGFAAPQWVGVENFEGLLDDKRFKEAVVHNLLILLAMPIWILVPYGVAWGLFSKVWGWRFFRFAFFIPVVLSPVVIGIYYGIVLNPSGPFNELLRAIGLGGIARAWLNEPDLALPIVIAIMIWATFGIGTMIFLSALSNLDQEQIEAARVDGASPFQVQRHVIFWQLLPVIEFWAVLILILSFTAFFPLIYTLTGGGPGSATYTVDFDLYTEAFKTGALGYASAIGVAMLVIMGALGAVLVAVLRWRRA